MCDEAGDAVPSCILAGDVVPSCVQAARGVWGSAGSSPQWGPGQGPGSQAISLLSIEKIYKKPYLYIIESNKLNQWHATK
jgi:hypothetical protein